MKIIAQLVLFFIVASFSSSSLVSYAISFSFSTFTATSCRGGVLSCMGSVTSTNGHLSLTPDTDNPPARGRIGRVLYRNAVSAWPASISTTFTVNMAPFNIAATAPADGLTFIMAPNNGPSPANSGGGYLGLSNDNLDGNLSGTLAVELDTFRNTWDINANHAAVITRSVRNPLISQSLTGFRIYLTSGRDIRVQINYSSNARLLSLYMGYTTDPLQLILSRSINLQGTVPRSVYVGFTASTGDSRGTHKILNWSFSSTPQQPLVDDGDEHDHRMGINNSSSTQEQPMDAENMIISAI